MTDIIMDEQKKLLERLEYIYSGFQTKNEGPTSLKLYEQVMAIDHNIRKRSMVKALIVGVVGLLFFVTGYNILIHLQNSFLFGIIIFSIGVIMIAIAYPIYNYLIRKMRKKYALVVMAIISYLKLNNQALQKDNL